MKTLKQSGVPFGARTLFRLQHMGFLLFFCVPVLLLMPVFLALVLVLPAPTSALMKRLRAALDQRHDLVEAHRQRVIKLYSDGP